MRIVSLCPSLTELVFDLGAGDALVGRTKFCVHPQGAVERVESIGGTKNPRVARIIELAPDLVLMNAEENRREDADAIAAAGVTVHASMPRTAAETAAMVRDIGAAIHTKRDGERVAQSVAGIALDIDARAERIAADIEARAERVRAAWANSAPVSYAYLIWREPWMAANDDTFVAGLLSLAGGRNVFGAEKERYPTIDPMAWGQASPDRVLLSSEPFPFGERHLTELVQLTGLPMERFHLVDGELLSWHGSRTPRGIDYAERVLRRGKRD